MFLFGENAPFSQGLLSHLSRQFQIRKYTPGDVVQSHDLIICLDQSKLSILPLNVSILLVLPLYKESLSEPLPDRISVIQIGEEVTDAEYAAAIRSLFGFSKTSRVVIGKPMIIPQKENIAITPASPVKPKKRVISYRLPSPRPFIYLLIVLLISFSIPFVTLGLSVSSLYLSMKLLVSNPSLASGLNGFSRTTATVSRVTLTPLAALPVVKPQVSYFLQLATLSLDASQVVNTGALVLREVQSLTNKLKSGETVNWKETGLTLSPLLATLYRDGSFLLANGGDVLSLSVINKNADLPYLFSYLPIAEQISREAGRLVGQERPFTYMILFQNAAELRPTGGFLGSYALVTTQGGKIVSKEIQDVYDADGKINGYVKPPLPVATYLKEASWHLRDSNWDVDFPTTAERITWFLDKAIDVKPDAIVAINTLVLTKILSVTGPVHPAGWETDAVGPDNLYQMLERRGGDSFFPGSIRKKTYLSALSESVLNALFQLPQEKVIALAKEFNQLARAKEIMVWFQDDGLQSAMETANLSGAFKEDTCGESCQSIIHQIVEANVGINKVNPYITRSVTETVTNSDSQIEGEVVLHISHKGGYQNNGNESYKTYVRLLLPKEATVDASRVTSSTLLGSVLPEVSHEDKYLSAGVLVTVIPGETSTVSFNWKMKTNSNRAQIFWVKQPGVAPFTLSLTATGVGVYNTSLTDSKVFNLQK